MFWQYRYAASSRIDEILEEYKSAASNDVKNSSEGEIETSKAETECAAGDSEEATPNNENIELNISTLSELLNEDDLLQEVRAKNQQLLDFLCQKSVFDYMVAQITTEPSEMEFEIFDRFKKPSVISEILSSCTDQICGCLIESPRLDTLWTLLSQTTEINPLQASFFSKVVTSLFPGYAKQFSEYLVSRNHIMSSLVNHIGNSAFADVIMRIVTYQDNESIRDEILEYMKSQKLVALLINSLGSASDNQAKMNSAMVLEDLIRLSRDHLIATIEQDQTDLTELKDQQCAFLLEILSTGSIELLLSQMSANSNNVTTVGFTIKLFVSMITAKPMALSIAGANEEYSANTLNVLNQTVSLAFKMLNPVFDHLCSVFSSPPTQRQLMLSSSDSPQVPFGWVRLEIVELVVAILEQFSSNVAFFVESSADTLFKLVEFKIISSIIASVFEYPNNNILHGLAVKLTRSYFSICSSLKTLPVDLSEKIANLDMPKYFFTQTDILKHLNESWENEINRRLKKKGSGDLFSTSSGNFGHVITLTGLINKFLQDNECSEVYISAEIEQHWKSTVTEEVDKITKEYERPLGGTNPNKYSTDDDDSSSAFPEINDEPALQKAFLEYSTQEMTTDTSQFESLTGPKDLDEFFSGKSLQVPQFKQSQVATMSDADHERSANLFESLCEQRLNSFKGLDDDLEDMDLSSSSKQDEEQQSAASLNQSFTASFDAKFNQEFSYPFSSTINNNTEGEGYFPPTSEAVDPFASYDLFSTPFNDQITSEKPSDVQVQLSNNENSDPFGDGDVASTNEPSNWADFTNFGNGPESDPVSSTAQFNDSTVPPLVLQSVELSEDTKMESNSCEDTTQVFNPFGETAPNDSSSTKVESDEKQTPPPVLFSDASDDDNIEQLGENFNFLSSGLVKSFSSSQQPETLPDTGLAAKSQDSSEQNIQEITSGEQENSSSSDSGA